MPLPTVSDLVRDVSHWLQSVPLAAWLGGLGALVLTFLGPRIRQFLPNMGVGQFVTSARLAKKVSIWSYFWRRSPYTFFPVLTGAITLSHNRLTFASALLLVGGAVQSVLAVVDQNKARSLARLYENKVKIAGGFYPFRYILNVQRTEFGRRLVMRKNSIEVSHEEWEKWGPHLLEVGYGDDMPSRQDLNLK